jgi:uncharacterized protein
LVSRFATQRRYDATIDARVYAQAAEARVGHLRTAGGEHEVDLSVERDDRRILAIEVKLRTTVDDRDVRDLKWLSERLDGIGVIPAALLGA